MQLLSLHAVFILNENIKWLDEYIQYYLTIGFDHFYLYHNEGSIGDVDHGASSTFTKYHIPINTTSSQDDLDKLQLILDKYTGYITYLKWQPRNEKGEIIHGQDDSVRHCIKHYGHETKWLAHVDLDEYIFSPSNIDIRKYFTELDDSISCIKICQKKFKDRHLSSKSRILEEYNCIDMHITDFWGAKNIFRPFDLLDITDVHSITFKHNTRVIADQTQLRFNHYNVNDHQLRWMKYAFHREYSLNMVDDSMKRYIKTD